jgi:ferredoxin
VPTIIINDKPVEADLGEGLLTVARREKAHIGFICDGNGLCTTCECLVLEGAENLSEPNDVEKVWLPESRLKKGYRLACQANIEGKGPVTILTRAEFMRLAWLRMFVPPEGRTRTEYLISLWNQLFEINVQHIGRWPNNLLTSWSRLGLGKLLWPVQDTGEYVRDMGAVFRAFSPITFQFGKSDDSEKASPAPAPTPADSQPRPAAPSQSQVVPPASQPRPAASQPPASGQRPPTNQPPNRGQQGNPPRNPFSRPR